MKPFQSGPSGQKQPGVLNIFDLQHFKMHHPLWPDHHGKRVWAGSIPSTDSEYVKLFNQAAGAPSQKEALEARRRF